ncbi:MAG: hypothetical protein ACI9Y1_002173 [Lentisphaeria bacterium]|jgi:hypothetical protein
MAISELSMTIDTFTTIDQFEEFLTGAETYHYCQLMDSKDERHTWLQKTLLISQHPLHPLY